MKLQRLELLAFGSLRGVTLELASAAPCLHVIYGPNEAGKSTALRAVTSLFYGVPENTVDTHSIKGPELRVGALLQDSRGRELYVVRRKGRKETLRNAAGEPLPGAESSWLHAGMSEDTFRSLFGLSYATLHEGAEAILSSAGDLGQSLYSAAVGGGRVRALIDALEQEAALLFKPRGRNQLLNEALSLFDEAKHRSREQAMQASAFSEQQAGIEATEGQLARLAQEHLSLRTERERLERARRVLPLLAKRTQLAAERAELGEVARLAANAPEERRRIERARRDAALRVEHEQAECARLERELEGVAPPATLVALEPALAERLRDRLGAYRRGQSELPRRREALRRAQDELFMVKAQLGLADAAGSLEALRVPRPVELRVREQAARRSLLTRTLAEHSNSCEAKREALETQRRALAQLWHEPADAAGAMPLTAAALPSDDTLDAFERASLELEHALRSLGEQRAALDAERERNLRDLTALELEGALPSEVELTQLRATRTERFADLRARLSAPAAPSQIAASVELLDQAESATERADQLADRLRREASRVAEHARLEAQRQALERAYAKLEAEQRACELRGQQSEQAFRVLFTALGVRARSPRQARNLLSQQRAAEARVRELEGELWAQERERARCSEQLHEAQAEWQALAASVCLPELASSAEVDAILDGRSELLMRYSAVCKLERELGELEAELHEFERDAQTLCQQHLPTAVSSLPDAAAEQLLRQHQLTRDQLARRQQLTAALSARRSELQQAQAATALAEREQQFLLEAAAVTDLSQLEQAELRSARACELDAQLAQLQAELLAASDGQSPRDVADQVEASLDEVRARLLTIDEQLEAHDRARHDATHQLANFRAGLDRLRESHGAGDAALEAASQLEGIRTLALRYARVRLASRVLEREVERYREQNRAPILRRAGSLFARLTLGGFSGLDVDYGASDEPLLSCVRASGERVAVSGLSSGTRDQLYLALRLASIEHLSSKQELMPLLLDDILVHFDDARARAALSVLAEFADTTQILFFTHHHRLCELAREALPAERFRLHRLSEPQLQLSVLS